MISILHQSILSSAPILSKSFKTAAVTAASGGDTTIGFVAAASGFRSDSDEGVEPNAPDSTALLSSAIKEQLCDMPRLQARAAVRQATE